MESSGRTMLAPAMGLSKKHLRQKPWAWSSENTPWQDWHSAIPGHSSRNALPIKALTSTRWRPSGIHARTAGSETDKIILRTGAADQVNDILTTF